MKKEQEQSGLRIAVVSYDVLWLRVMSRYCSEHGAFVWADYYTKGSQLLDALAIGSEVQVVILDEQMQDMDLLVFMKEYWALELKNPPIMIGMCSKRHLGYTSCLYSLGIVECVTKPVQIASLASRAIFLQYTRSDDAVKRFCEELYREWGVEASDNATYLIDAVKIAYDSNEKLAVRKEIIWRIAEMRGCSHAAVDSGLRRLIEKTEKTAEGAYRSFKEKSGLGEKKPTVGELVYALKNQIKELERERIIASIQ